MVFETEADFEILPERTVDELATRADTYEPRSYDTAWLPSERPTVLERIADGSAPIGSPGDGAVIWTRTTTPPTVLVKPRIEGSPESFVAFLIAEALVEAGSDLPEHFLGLFEAAYPTFATALDLDPATTYQIAAASTAAYRGHTVRPICEGWGEDCPDLHAAWVDAGERIRPRVEGLVEAVDAGRTGLGDAAELAGAAVKHGIEPPGPFAALADERFQEHGAPFAVAWAERLGAALDQT